MKKTYIFDLDGTLIDSLTDIADSMNSVLSEFGIEGHSKEKYRKFVGNGIYNLAKRSAGEDKSEEIVNGVYERFLKVYGEHFMDKTVPYDGILTLLLNLKKKGVYLAVLSNKKQNYSEEIAKKLFNDIFDIVVGGRDDMESKPSKVPVEYILNELGADKEGVCMIGDSNVDIFTAQNAGIKSVGCVWGFRGEEELKDAGADYVVYKPEDIEDIL